MKIALAIASSAACLVASLLFTGMVWETQVGGHAFDCTDAGFTLSLAYWTDADSHRSAGDKIQPGWTWEKVAALNGYYKLAFFALWLGGTMAACRLFHKHSEDEL